MLEEKKCERVGCGKAFKPVKWHQKFCCKDCGRKGLFRAVAVPPQSNKRGLPNYTKE